MASRRLILPFREARTYARCLGLNSHFEWREWCREGKRPHFLPSCPESAYPIDFDGYPDWLGYERKNVFKSLPADELDRTIADSNSLTHGLSVFLDHLRRYAPGFEIMALPREASAAMLFRPRRSESDSDEQEWTPLVVRTVKTRNGTLSFHGMKRNPDVQYVFGFDIESKEVYVFPIAGKESVPATTTIYPTYELYSKYKMSSAEISIRLQESWEKQEKANRKKWFLTLFRGKEDKTWANSVVQLWTSLYDPLNMRIDSQLSLFGFQCYLTLSGKVFLHRNVIFSNGEIFAKLTRMINHRAVPYYADEKIDFFVFSVRGEKDLLCGVYIFPKEVLAQHGFLKKKKKIRI